MFIIVTPSLKDNYQITGHQLFCIMKGKVLKIFVINFIGPSPKNLNSKTILLKILLLLINLIHFNMEMFSALVWGSSVKHMPQKVGKDHELEDEDVVQIVKKI